MKAAYSLALVLLASTVSWTASAQVPVVEAGNAAASKGQAAAPGAGGGNEFLLSLYTQLQALQTEVQDLRGLVEEQAYQIRKMQADEKDRYLDIDRRLSSTGAGGNTPGILPLDGSLPTSQTSPQDQTGDTAYQPPYAGNSSTTPQLTGTQPEAPVSGFDQNTTPDSTVPATDPAVAQLNEQDLYRTALNLLLQDNNYEEAITLFQRYIDNFPGGRLLTNSLYWQGEALILAMRYSQAKDVFSKVIGDYPKDPKAPGAMLKLGVAYSKMGEKELARSTWQQLPQAYPENATEIKAAQDYLSKL